MLDWEYGPDLRALLEGRSAGELSDTPTSPWESWSVPVSVPASSWYSSLPSAAGFFIRAVANRQRIGHLGMYVRDLCTLIHVGTLL